MRWLQGRLFVFENDRECCKVSVQLDLVNGEFRGQTGHSEENT